MATVFVLLASVVIVATIVGVIGLLRWRLSPEVEFERRSSSHRRRMLLRMLHTRSSAAP